MNRSNATQVPTPEFSRRVVVEEIPAAGDTREIVAEPEERDALARRFGLLAFGELSASLRLQPLAHGLVRVADPPCGPFAALAALRQRR